MIKVTSAREESEDPVPVSHGHPLSPPQAAPSAYRCSLAHEQQMLCHLNLSAPH